MLHGAWFNILEIDALRAARRGGCFQNGFATYFLGLAWQVSAAGHGILESNPPWKQQGYRKIPDLIGIFLNTSVT